MSLLQKLISYRLYIFLVFFISCSGGGEPKPFDCNFSDLEIDVAKIDPADCVSTGSIEISGLLGEEPYQFALNEGNFQASGIFSNVISGTHVAKVKDKKGCVVVQNISLVPPSSTAEIQDVSLELSGCKTNEGSITVTAAGVGSISFSLDNEDFSNTTGIFSSLGAGTYSLYIKDEDGCTDFRSNVKVTTGVSLTTDVFPIIDSNCATNSNCHVNGGDAPFALVTKEQIISRAADIKSAAVTQGTMPKNNPGGLPTASKNLIACWVDDGAPNN